MAFDQNGAVTGSCIKYKVRYAGKSGRNQHNTGSFNFFLLPIDAYVCVLYKMKRIPLHTIVLAFFGVIALLSLWSSQTGCANASPPVGGPRDSIPPFLVAARPADSSKNFTGKKIVLQFNEYVQLQDVTKNLLVTPTPKINPTIEGKLRTVTITIKDTLEPNTTYSIDFGDAIRDVNESNALRNFTYTFSTGAYIDSLTLSGKVILAENGKTDSTLVAMLYTKGDDSTAYKERPRYVARLDKEGKFQFHHLPDQQFYLYVLKDESGLRRYLNRTQLFGFMDEPVRPSRSPEAGTIYAYAEKEPPKRTTPPRATVARGAAADKRLRFETNLQTGEQDLLKSLEFSFKSAPLKYLDSSKVQFIDENKQPISNYSFQLDTSRTKITLKHSWKENTAYYLIVDKDFAEDTAGRKLLKNDTLLFRTRKESSYGLIRLRFPNLDLKKNPVLLFVQNDEIVHSYVFTSKDYTAKLFQPGEYELRVLYDTNKNKVWDPGNFFGTRRQPEIVAPISRKLTVKANWDNEVDINL